MVESLSKELSVRASDGLARIMGSWSFVLGQALFLLVWFILNVGFFTWQWDPYPFILANLAMSAQAAFATPILLMSQNRASDRDRSTLQHDVKLDEEALVILKNLEEKIDGLVSGRTEA